MRFSYNPEVSGPSMGTTFLSLYAVKILSPAIQSPADSVLLCGPSFIQSYYLCLHHLHMAFLFSMNTRYAVLSPRFLLVELCGADAILSSSCVLEN